MGCCVSTDKASAPPNPHHFSFRSDPPIAESRAPPPVEESVKEVLSETPNSILPVSNLQEVGPDPKPTKPVFDSARNDDVQVEDKKLLDYYAAEEISEVSEICSQSDTVSTTTMTDRRDEEEEQARQRSAAKFRQTMLFPGDPGKRMSAGKSPTRNRRADQSTGRRSAAPVRLVQSREATSRRNGVRSEPNRRDPGERSGRRSKSPAIARTEGGGPARSAVGRSPSARRTNRSPGRIEMGPPDRKAEEVCNSNESLENPLVSLECFIFL